MKITDVRFVALRHPLAEPIRLAWGPMTHRHFGLVLIETDAGITGVGETSVNFPHWAITERRATVEAGVRHLLVGEDPLRVEHLWQKMYHSLIRLGLLWGKGAIMSAIGGADIALWDIVGKAYGLPVYPLRDVSPTPLREDVLAEPLDIADGHARVPSGPGLGIALNEEVIAR